MKRFLSILTLICVLFSLCACGKNAQTATEPTSSDSGLKELTNEDLYGHIDQFTPLAGTYKIWNAEGFKNIANHPDGKFELLCNIDMEGAVLAPIPEFTGDIMGADCSVSNFTVQGDGENFGFIGVNKGKIRNLILNQVTFVPGANAKNIGSLAGVNEDTILRCTVNGDMTVDQAAEGAACGSITGMNTGSLTNTSSTVALYYNAPGAATVGGITGIAQGGTVDKITINGRITVAGANKTMGLLAGTSENVVLNGCAFLGEDNSLDGKLVTSFTGNEDDENVTVTDARLRDNGREPLPDNVRALREKVVKAMYDMGTVEWRVKQDLMYTDRMWSTTYQFKGIPYNHKSGSLAQAMTLIGEDGYLVDEVYDWATSDSWDMYFGNDCSGALQQAWWTVSNSTDVWVCQYLYPYEGQGALPVGDWEWEFSLSDFGTPLISKPYIEATGEERMYEAYALLRAGDAVNYHTESGGHTRMIAEDAVVVRTQDGKIDPQLSYVISHEQGNAVRDDEAGTYSTWNLNRKQYFANLLFDNAVPITCEELITGEMEPVEAKLEGKQEGYAGMISGVVQTNYHLESVTLKITDSDGNVVLDKPYFVDVCKNSEFGNAYYRGRNFNTTCEMANLAIFLADAALQPGQSYNYTVTADLATFDHIVVNEGNFTYGS